MVSFPHSIVKTIFPSFRILSPLAAINMQSPSPPSYFSAHYTKTNPLLWDQNISGVALRPSYDIFLLPLPCGETYSPSGHFRFRSKALPRPPGPQVPPSKILKFYVRRKKFYIFPIHGCIPYAFYMQTPPDSQSRKYVFLACNVTSFFFFFFVPHY